MLLLETRLMWMFPFSSMRTLAPSPIWRLASSVRLSRIGLSNPFNPILSNTWMKRYKGEIKIRHEIKKQNNSIQFNQSSRGSFRSTILCCWVRLHSFHFFSFIWPPPDLYVNGTWRFQRHFYFLIRPSPGVRRLGICWQPRVFSRVCPSSSSSRHVPWLDATVLIFFFFLSLYAQDPVWHIWLHESECI